MNFASPIAFALALLAAPIVLLYLLKVRLRRVPVSTNLFWRQIYDEKPPRALWRRLRHLVSLLVQLLFLILVVLALTDPALSGRALEAARVVAVVDNSASMRAADTEPSRFDAAIRAAIDEVERLRHGDEMAIVVAGPSPEVALGMSGHVPTLRRALQDLRPTDYPTRLAPATELARRLVGDHPHGRIIVFTDGCTEPAEPEGAPAANLSAPEDTADSPQPTPVEYRLVGGPADNIGITRFQVRRSPVDPLGYQVLVSVLNASDRPVSCRLELELAGLPVDVLPLNLEAEETWSRSLEKVSQGGGLLSARITQVAADESNSDTGDRNLLPTDDTAWAVLPPRHVQPVLIVTEGNLFLQKVFEANPLVRVEMRRDLPEAWPDDTVVVLHRQVPAVLPPVPLFVVNPEESCDLWDLGETLQHPLITRQERASPLMTHVNLDNVLLPEARKLTMKAPCTILAGALTEDPVYAEVSRPEGKCLVLSVNLEKSDLAFRTAFPIMVANALNWFAGGDGGEWKASHPTGSVVPFAQPAPIGEADGRARVLIAPDGREHSLEAQHSASAADPAAVGAETVGAEAAVSLGPFDQCGIWTVSGGGAPEAHLAVNLADAGETDLRPRDPSPAAGESSGKRRRGGTRPIWYYLVATACCLSICEWALHQRRILT